MLRLHRIILGKKIVTNLSEHKTDHLFLIVGSNPLPNYVAAQLLWRKVKPEREIH